MHLESAVMQIFNTVGWVQCTTATILAEDHALCLKVHLLDACNPWTAQPAMVMPRQQGVEYFVEHHGTSLYIMTNRTSHGEMCIMTAHTSQLPHRCAICPH